MWEYLMPGLNIADDAKTCGGCHKILQAVVAGDHKVIFGVEALELSGTLCTMKTSCLFEF